MLQPTDEQTAALDAFRAGDHLVLQAGAGTGKTTTLALLSNSTSRRGRYIAFNKTIALDAARTFPATVQCKTAHALAFAAIGHRYLPRMNAPRIPAWKTGMALGINTPLQIGDRTVSPRALSSAVLRTVTRFCHSADRTLQAHHVPPMRGIEAEPLHKRLVDTVLPYAHKAWADLQHPTDGIVRFDHDHYLKIWALSDPTIPADYLLLDEAQDTNPVLEHLFNAQRTHAQLVMVGDSAQAIYGWRGARDVMTDFQGTQLHLSQSFRFGPALADEANRWLTIVDAPIRLHGSPTIPTRIGATEHPDAILCRTNVGAMIEIMRLLDHGHTVALIGTADALHALAQAARDLMEGRRTTHPELLLFESWSDLHEYATYDPAGHDLQPLVDLVDKHGPDAICAAVARLSSEQRADVVVSTVHKAKGREWATVRIGGDFTEPKPQGEDKNDTPTPGPIDDAEARLAYVAVTRARHRLDRGSLSWIDHHPAGA